MKIDIILAGVGGQGILSIASTIGVAAVKKGLYLKQAEVHGMSQRGGSVVTYVRFGEKVYSPIVTEGEADFIVSFEKLEAARWSGCLAKNGQIIVNTQQIDPMPVIIGQATYPADILDELRAGGAKVEEIDALSLAMQAGSVKAVNIVLMARLAKYMEIPYEKWIAALEKTVAPKFLELNKKAFAIGYAAEKD